MIFHDPQVKLMSEARRLGHAKETYVVESVQDFLIKLGIKPCMHLWEISILSLDKTLFYHMVRPTHILNGADKKWAYF